MSAVTQRSEVAAIRFDATLSTIGTAAVLRLPEMASRALPSRGQILRQMLSPFARRRLPDAPGVATVLLRSLMVHRERLSDSYVLITPPLPDDASVMDWHRHAELAERAYDHTAKIIADQRARGHPLFR